MFINFSNHPSAKWSREQISEAEKYGEIVDIEFPSVPAEADEKFVEEVSARYVGYIAELSPECVMCQGEFTLAYAVITGLLRLGIKTVAASSDRKVFEQDGKKVSVFTFERFREYTCENDVKGDEITH